MNLQISGQAVAVPKQIMETPKSTYYQAQTTFRIMNPFCKFALVNLIPSHSPFCNFP